MNKNLMLVIALLLFVVTAGPASAAPVPAGPRAIPLHGSQERHFGAPARVWVDDQGLTHFRDLPMTGTFSAKGPGVTLQGTQQVMSNATLDDKGNGVAWSTVTYTDAATGLTCRGSAIGAIADFLATQYVAAVCSDGRVLSVTLRDTQALPVDQTPPEMVRSDIDGELVSSPFGSAVVITQAAFQSSSAKPAGLAASATSSNASQPATVGGPVSGGPQDRARLCGDTISPDPLALSLSCMQEQQ